MLTNHIRIGVLRGGPSHEYEVSLDTGKQVLTSLREHFSDRYHAKDIFIDREGLWHIDGLALKPEQILSKIDVAFNALHGKYGEDGKIQHLLESYGIPFTGSGSLGSAVGMNKTMAKNLFRTHGLKTPYWQELSQQDILDDHRSVANGLFHSWHLPILVKPVGSGSSVGVSIVRNYKDLPLSLYNAARHGHVLVEEYVPGIETTCGVIEDFRGEDLYSLPPIEIRPKNSFFDYEAKYAGGSEKIVPATFSRELKSEIEELSKSIHRLLGLRHYSRSDFIIHPRRGIYVLETNTLPGLTEESLIPKSLKAVGSSINEFIGHIISLANQAR